jgi:hypothetical protein
MSQTLDELATLPDDWDGYGTPGPTQAAIQIGRELLEALKRVGPRPSHLGPSAIGGISYAFISGRDIASLEVSNEGAVSAALIPRADPPKVWDVDWPADRERTLFGIHDGLYGQERIP